MHNSERHRKNNLGFFITSPLTEEIVRQLEISFVDDNNFASDENHAEKIVKILKRCTQLCEATAGIVQFDNTYFFSWIWKRDNGKFKVENIECALEVNNTGIIQLKVKEVIRTLGVHVFPQLH